MASRTVIQDTKKFLLNIIATNNNEYVIAMSTNVDTSDDLVFEKVSKFYGTTDRVELSKQAKKKADLYFKRRGIPFINSTGYWQGQENKNSYLAIVVERTAKEVISHAQDWFGQDEILAFGPDCTLEIFDRKKDYCTLVGDLWLRFMMDGTILKVGNAPGRVANKLAVRHVRDGVSESNKDPVELSKWNAETIVDAAYRVAPKVYYTKNWKNTNYDLDDFVQDAAMYILELYNDRYFPLDRENIDGMIYKMLKTFSFNKNRSLQNKASKTFSINSTDSDDKPSATTFLPADTLDPSQEEALDYAKELLEEIVENDMKDQPFMTRKHTYRGKLDTWGDTGFELSEQNIAKLLLSGYGSTDIMNIYDSFADNIGASSKATYVYKKVNHVIDKLADVINQKPDYERKAIADYMEQVLGSESYRKFNTK